MKSGVPGFQGLRLRQAREAMSLSITSLAAIVGVSKQAISQYERGADSPGQEVFDRLRNTLTHEAHFFLKRPNNIFSVGTNFYRSMASTTKTARSKAEVWQIWTRELISEVLEFVEFPVLNFPAFDDVPNDVTMLGTDLIEAIASEVRERWNLGDGPITNLVEVAERNGVIIVRHSLDAETLDALSAWLEPEGFPFVALNADKNVAVRSRADIAHELGHLFLHRRVSMDHLRRSDLFRLIENQAFRFGGALLLPAHSFLEDLYSLSLDGLQSLKLKWKVSIALMIERLRDLEILNHDQYRRLRINYSARQWSKKEPYDDEIAVEEPGFLTRALNLMLEGHTHTIDQLSADTGFSRDWIERLLNVPPGLGSPKPQLKLLDFKRRA